MAEIDLWRRDVCPETAGNSMIGHRDAGGQFLRGRSRKRRKHQRPIWVEHEVPTLPQNVLLTMPFKQVPLRCSCPWSARVDLRTHGVLDEDEDQYNEEQDDNERCGIDAAAAAAGLDRINA